MDKLKANKNSITLGMRKVKILVLLKKRKNRGKENRVNQSVSENLREKNYFRTEGEK